MYRQRIVPRANMPTSTMGLQRRDRPSHPGPSHQSSKRSDVSSRAHPRARILCGAAVELGRTVHIWRVRDLGLAGHKYRDILGGVPYLRLRVRVVQLSTAPRSDTYDPAPVIDRPCINCTVLDRPRRASDPTGFPTAVLDGALARLAAVSALWMSGRPAPRPRRSPPTSMLCSVGEDDVDRGVRRCGGRLVCPYGYR